MSDGVERLERTMMGEVEGGNRKWRHRIMRHEAGHAILLEETDASSVAPGRTTDHNPFMQCVSRSVAAPGRRR